MSSENDEIAEANYTRRKEELKFLDYFLELREKLKPFCTINWKPDQVPIIERKELDKNLRLLREMQDDNDRKIFFISSDPSTWLPFRIKDIVGWVFGFRFTHDIDNLALQLIEAGYEDIVLQVLSKYDKKAKPRKVRNKFPKELLGKSLSFTKMNDDRWIVTVKKDVDLSCKYKKNHDKWYVKDQD